MSTYTCMTLGDWIDTLEKLPGGMRIRLDTGQRVGRLISWRGIYAHLAIEPADPPDGGWETVAGALQDARDADGGTFEGYKGGDYTMNRGTPLWVSAYGDSDHVRPIGVQVIEQDGQEIVEVVTVANAFVY